MPDQLSDFGAGTWAASFAARFPSPVEPEALALPFDHGLGLDDKQYGLPVGPKLRQYNPKQVIAFLELRRGLFAVLAPQAAAAVRDFPPPGWSERLRMHEQ